MSDRQNPSDRTFPFQALCAAIVAEAAKGLPRKFVAGLRATCEDFQPRSETEPGDISQRGIRSAIVAFHLKVGAKPAEIAELPGVVLAGPFEPSVAIAVMDDAVERSFRLPAGTPPQGRTEEKRQVRSASACSYLLIELYGVAATEWHNADADASIRSGDETVCHVVAMSLSQEQALLQQLGMTAAPAAEFLATPCGLVSVADGLARVPKERRLAAAAEIIRYLNILPQGTHADVDRLIDVAAHIYG